jgi:hypothetical protein
MLLLLLPAASTEALACALLPGYSEADVWPDERAFADAASAARLSEVLLNLLQADILSPQQSDTAVDADNYSHRARLLQQRHAPWLSKPWPLDPVDKAFGPAAAADGAKGAAKIRQRLRQRFPGLGSRDRRGLCGLEHGPRTMQAAVTAAMRGTTPDWLHDTIAGATSTWGRWR